MKTASIKSIRQIISRLIREVSAEQTPFDSQEGGRYESVLALVEKVFRKAVELGTVRYDDPRLIEVCEDDEEHSWVAEEHIPDPDKSYRSYDTREIYADTNKSSVPLSHVIANSVKAFWRETRVNVGSKGNYFPEDRGKIERKISKDDAFWLKIHDMPSKRYMLHRAEEIELIAQNVLSDEATLTTRHTIEVFFRDITREIMQLDAPVLATRPDPQVENIVRAYESRLIMKHTPEPLGWHMDIYFRAVKRELEMIPSEIYYWYTEPSRVHKFKDYIRLHRLHDIPEDDRTSWRDPDDLGRGDKVEILQMPEQEFFDYMTSRHV